MIYPEGQEAAKEGGELEITKKKREEMVEKAKELLVKPMEIGELCDALEQYYVFEKNEHYTSAQLKDIAEQVASDLAPVVEEEVLEA